MANSERDFFDLYDYQGCGTRYFNEETFPLSLHKTKQSMQIRKQTMNDVIGQQRMQKAVAIAICMKRSLGRHSTIRNYNPHKVQTMTGINQNTFRKYRSLMVDMGLLRFEGNNAEHLVVCCLHSKDKKRNIDIHLFCFKSFTEVYNSLRAFLALLIQQRKDYVCHILQIARNPKRGEDCAAARKAVRRLVRRGVLKSVSEDVREWGMSLKRIAKETGNCVRTAERIVSYASHKRWWRKTRHYERYLMRGVNRRYVPGFTFTTMNYGFIVHPNSYELSAGIARSLGMV